jgi:hypothetical protein
LSVAGGFLKVKARLAQAMTVSQFDNGYWYATELRDFAKTIGIPAAATLRKDELETAIKAFLETGRIESPPKRDLERREEKDVALGLRLDRPVLIYTNDRETKEFIEQEARRLAPGFKRKSGSRYRLNRWREEQLAKGVKITYGDVVREYVQLNQSEMPFERVPHGRYINFMSDFLAKEAGATREDAIKAWHTLKILDMPKTYESWGKFKSSKRR